MRTLFRAHFRPTAADFDALWADAAIVLDANFLLDMHRVSADTRLIIQDVLTKYRDRLYVPHQFALESARNRASAVCDHISSYDDATKRLNALVEEFEDRSRHPFLSAGRLSQLREAVEELRAQGRAHEQSLSENDEITEWIVNLITSERVGQPLDAAEMDKLQKDGEARFRDKVPPGYMDAQKPLNRRYGDLIAWRQILKYAKGASRNVIFVTSKKKEDWWLKQKRWTLGPRPELIEEFERETQQRFYAYSTQEFLKRAAERADLRMPEEALREVQAVEDANRRRETLEAEKASAPANALSSASGSSVYDETKPASPDPVIEDSGEKQ